MGRGSFVSELPESETKEAVKTLYKELARHIRELILRGESKDDIAVFIERFNEAEQGGLGRAEIKNAGSSNIGAYAAKP